MHTLHLSPLSHHEIQVFETVEELALKTVHYLSFQTVALSGGSTFKRLMPQWVTLKPQCQNTTFFPVDERMVPLDDPQSNWGTIYQELLIHVSRQQDLHNAAVSVQHYSDLLSVFFGDSIPVFDVIFLGVGTDGHTASIFPGSEALHNTTDAVGATWSVLPPFPRITLLPPVLSAAKKLITIIMGIEKKDIVTRLFSKDVTIPITRLLSLRESSTIFIQKELLDHIRY